MEDAPRVEFGAPMLPDIGRLSALLAETIASGRLTNGGPLSLRLEEALTAMQVPDDLASLTSSGTMALTLALMLGRLPVGAEVITTPLSFAATAQAITACGLVPVFADVAPDTLTLCPRAVEAAITPRTAAIVPVHFLGVPCDLPALQEIAKRHGLWLVHDAAHAFGASYDGVPIGHFGDASAFSLHATKLLHTAEGGFVVTRAERSGALRQLRNFGLDRGLPTGPGLNGKLSEVQAAVGLTLLPDLPAELAARRRLRAIYDMGIAVGRRRQAGTAEGENHGFYTLRLPAVVRARLHAALAAEGILARDHFPLLCGPGTIWEGFPVVTADGGPAVAPSLGPEVLCLPFHGRVTEPQAERIVRITGQVCAEALPEATTS